MNVPLLVGLLGCGSSAPEEPSFSPVEDWRGTAADVVLASKPRFTPETALAAAVEAGVVINESDPDYSGMWAYEPRDLGDGIMLEVRGLRQRAAPGVYHSITTLYKHQDFRPVLQVEATGFEVIGANMRCELIVKMLFSYVDEDERKAFRQFQERDGPDAVNADPCDAVIAWTPDSITSRGEDGVQYVEKRRRFEKKPEASVR